MGTKPQGQKKNFTRWRAQQHRCRPSFPWGTKPRGTTKTFHWGTKPQGRRKNFTRWRARQHRCRPSFLGERNPRENIMDTSRNMDAKRQHPISKGAVETTKKRFSQGKKPWGQKKSFPWGTKPQGQQQRQRPTFEGAVEQRQKRNDKDDAQPPRLRQTEQASPIELKMYFYVFTKKTPFNIVRKAILIKSVRKREQGGLTKNDWEF